MDEDAPGTTPGWLTVGDPSFADEAPAARSRVVYVAAAVPWLVVAFLLARPADTAPGGLPQVAARIPADASPSEMPVPVATGAAAGLHPATATITASGALVAVDEDEARAVAVVAARRWLTTVGPGATGDAGAHNSPADAGTYAEHLVVEGVDHPAPGAAVVTVRALVLQVDGDEYAGVEVRRVAVPLRFNAGGATPAGTPYLLPYEEPTAAPFELEPVTETELLLEAGEALAGAGFDVTAVHTLHRTRSWPLIVSADVRAGDGTAHRVEVWLRRHLGRLVVAGTRPRPPAAAPAARQDLPSSSPDAGDTAADDARSENEEVAP